MINNTKDMHKNRWIFIYFWHPRNPINTLGLPNYES